MKCVAHLLASALLALLVATTANARVEVVSAPGTVEAGTPFNVAVSGWLPDPCWEVISQSQIITESVVTFDIFTAYTAPPGSVCIQIVVPYEVFETVTIPAAGSWVLRVVEHRDNPAAPAYPDQVVEVEIVATSPAAVEKMSWGTLRAHYR